MRPFPAPRFPMPFKLDLNDLALFVEVVRAGSLSEGARRLGLPKSTVSRRLTEFERRQGSLLLQRSTRRLSLTDLGRAYFERAARIVDDIQEANGLLEEMQSAPKGTLRLSLPVDFTVNWLAEHLAAFSAAYPEVTLACDLSPRKVDFAVDPVDLAIRIGPLPEDHVVVRKLSDFRLGLFASPAFLAGSGPIEHPEDLAAHPCLLLMHRDQPMTSLRLSGPQGEVREVRIDGRIHTNNVGLARKLSLLGSGICLVPKLLCQDDVQAGRLIPLLPGWEAPPVAVNFLLPDRRFLPLKTRVFIDFLIARMEAERARPGPSYLA